MEGYAKQIKNNIKRMGLYGLLFGIMLIVFSIVNAKKVLDFWMYDEIDYNEWTVDLGRKGETDYVSNFWGKLQFINMNGLIRNLLGQKEMNGVIKLNNGYLLTPIKEVSDDVLLENANGLFRVKQYLDELEIPMLFVVAPYTSSKYDPQLPAGVLDYGNSNTDRFIEIVMGYGIDILDLRQEMYDDGIDQYSMMYKTDIHWTTQAGMYAAGKISSWIQKKTKTIVDEKVFDPANYTFTTYEKWHLGSNGQRTGRYFAGMDDFVLITPNFETSISNGDRVGTFMDILIDYRPLENVQYSSRYTYDSVMKKSLGDYVNNNSLNDLKLLVLSDSFGKASNPYLILGYKEMRYVSKLTKEYIEEYEPDVVVFIYYSGNISTYMGCFFP